MEPAKVSGGTTGSAADCADAPGQYRAFTVRNLDEWYEAFGVQPGQKLYLAPADRVRVW